MNGFSSERLLLVRVAAALLGLLGLTVWISFVNLGSFNFAVAIAIAVAKALLVAMYFMELRHSDRLLWVIAAAGILWLLLLFGGTLADLVTRNTLLLPGGG